MNLELKMPALSPTMATGTLAKWLVSVGDVVRSGEPIAEVESDKATMEVESAGNGRVLGLVVPAGTDDVPVGSVIALLSGDDVEAVSSEPKGGEVDAAAVGQNQGSTAPPLTATAGAVPQDRGGRATTARGDAPSGKSTAASPLAVRIAWARNIDLADVTGSGAQGRIVSADLRVRQLAAQTAILAEPAFIASSPVTQAALSPTIAKPGAAVRAAERAGLAMPWYQLTVRCNIGSLLTLRRELNTSLCSRGIGLDLDDLLIKALALSLEAVPDAHVGPDEEEPHRMERIDLAIPVDGPHHLPNPVLKDVGGTSLAAIASARKALMQRARCGEQTAGDCAMAGASIVNLGKLGAEAVSPLLRPPQTIAIGCAAAVCQPWNVRGGVELASMMAVTGSFDRRAVSGSAATRLMKAFRDVLEQPSRLLC